MSFTENGYYPDDVFTIIRRISDYLKSQFPTIALTADNILTTFIAAISPEINSNQLLIEELLENMSPLTASGIYLEKLANDAMIYKKPAIKANGYITCSGFVGGGSISEGASFSTNEGLKYFVSGSYEFPNFITMVRGATLSDVITFPYKNVTLSGVYSDTTLTGVITGSAYSYTGDTVTWNTGIFSYGQAYYVLPSGLFCSYACVEAETGGTGWNIGPNKILNNDGNVPSVEYVSNESGFYNGMEIESDTNLRYRLMKTSYKFTSLGRIESAILAVTGIMDAKVYQNFGTDKCSMDVWDETTLAQNTGLLWTPTGYFGFSFYPSTGINTLKEIVLYGYVTGANGGEEIPDLKVWLKLHYSGAYISSTGTYYAYSLVDKTILERDNLSTFQEIHIPLKYNGIENQSTYQVYLFQTGTESGFWRFCLTGGITTNYRNEIYVSGVASGTVIPLYKTCYGAPAYSIAYRPNEGFSASYVETAIESVLSGESEQTYSPICIQYTMLQAVPVYIEGYLKLYVLDGYVFSDVQEMILSNVGNYFRDMRLGDDVVFDQVQRIILNTPGVKKYSNIHLRAGTGTWYYESDEADIPIANTEYTIIHPSNFIIEES